MASNQLAVIPQTTIKRLDEIARSYRLANISENPFEATFATALAISELQSLFTPEVMAPIMNLMNSSLGFLTDRNGRANWKGETKPLYSQAVIRDVVIEATLRGFFVVGNEFNVITDRFYAAKNGLRRKVSSFPGLTELRDSYSVPKIIGETGAIVEAEATWKINGKPDNIKRTFAVKGDKYAGSDSYIGKATRKLLAAIHDRLLGVCTPEGDTEEARFEGAKEAQASEVNYNDPNARADDLHKKDCEAIEKLNARMRANGEPESSMEPMPERPTETKEPEAPKEAERTPAPEIPWREVKVVCMGPTNNGKSLSEYPVENLIKIKNAMVNWTKGQMQRPGVAEMADAINMGISELSHAPDAPALATKQEGLLNIIRASHTTEKAVLAWYKDQRGDDYLNISSMEEEVCAIIINAWPEMLDDIRKFEK